MKKQALNVFTDGLVTDYHPLTVKNTILTDALNATLVTTKGNEMILLNDTGNLKIPTGNGDYVLLKEGYIPVGVKEHHGIIYICSYNPNLKDCEIGTYPSPDYSVLENNRELTLPLKSEYHCLRNGSKKSVNPDIVLLQNELLLLYEERLAIKNKVEAAKYIDYDRLSYLYDNPRCVLATIDVETIEACFHYERSKLDVNLDIDLSNFRNELDELTYIKVNFEDILSVTFDFLRYKGSKSSVDEASFLVEQVTSKITSITYEGSAFPAEGLTVNLEYSEEEEEYLNSFPDLTEELNNLALKEAEIKVIEQKLNGAPEYIYDDITDLNTKFLGFDLNHPVNIEILDSYDGSVNLILNDGLNIPRLINSGFSVTDNNTCKIPNRYENKENYYNLENQSTFDLTTSLIRRTNKFPKINYNGVLNTGRLAVGNYVIYIKYCDDDGNETDFVGESSIISIFKGNDGDPFSIDGGVEDMNANKSIKLTITNIDTTYHYVKVYYTRTSSAMDSTRIPVAFSIDKKYPTESLGFTNTCYIVITGDENKTLIPISEINSMYFVSDASEAQAQCLNMLFLGNVTAQNPYYSELTAISLYVIPKGKRTLAKTKIGEISTKTYKDITRVPDEESTHLYPNEYYNTKNIYHNVGYWNEEYYRLGIVYIFDDNTKSSVYNIAGGEFTWEDNSSDIVSCLDPNITIPTLGDCVIEPLNYRKDKTTSNYILGANDEESDTNVRGVVHFNDINPLKEYLYSIVIDLPNNFDDTLKKFNVKGYFFVRQKRIPTIACLGYTLPWDKESKVPILTYYGERIGRTDISPINNDDKHDLGGQRLRYCVESFLTLVGNEMKVKSEKGAKNYAKNYKESEDEWTGAKNIRAVKHNYDLRLHYIMDWAIDQPMFKVDRTNYESNNILLVNTFFPAYQVAFSSDDESALYYYQMLVKSAMDAGSSAYAWDDGYYLKDFNSLESLIDTLSTHEHFYIFKVPYAYTFGDFYNALPEDIYNWSWDIILTKLRANENLILHNTICETAISRSELIQTFGTLENLELAYYLNDVRYNSLEEIVAAVLSEYDAALLNQTLTWIVKTALTNNSATYELDRITRTTIKKEGTSVEDNIFKDDGGFVSSGNITGGYFKPSVTYEINRKVNINLYNGFYQSKSGLEVLGYFINRKLVKPWDGTAEVIRPYYQIYWVKHFYDRYKDCDGRQLTAICPEFEVRLPYFNSLFTGTDYEIKYLAKQQGYIYPDLNHPRYYYTENNSNFDNNFYKKNNTTDTFKIVSVTDSVPTVVIDNTLFKSVLGSDAEAYRFEYINEEHCAIRAMKGASERTKSNGFDDTNCTDFNLARGIFTPYLGIVTEKESFNAELDIFRQCHTFNIYYKGSRNANTVYDVRFQDNSSYGTISPYYNLGDTIEDLYRGDCFLCTFTHRLNRNFNDPVAPSNDHIIDYKTWRDNYYPDTIASNDKDKGIERLNQINRGDVNAVKLGSWITIKVRSSYNLSIRSLDESHIQESGIMGRARGFYPLQQASPDGGYKIPNSYIINDGFGSTLSERYYETITDAPYLKNEFLNRIVYSDIGVNDAFINGYRVFRGLHYRDYTKLYGAITKLIELQGNILCIFEHGLALIPVNERALAAEGSGGEVYINNSNVLPETPRVLSDMFGSLWPDTIIKTPYYVYGIDVARKKIWRTNGSQFEVISDFRVEKFLVDNLTISENDSLPIIGIKDVVTHYNANKSDVIFTFYCRPVVTTVRLDECSRPLKVFDNEYSTKDEIAWSLCYNEILLKFLTFYSWIPIASANIDNEFYSFDRECSREIIVPTESKEVIKPKSSKTESENLDWSPIAKNMYKERLTPYLWKHGLIDLKFPYPCFWYNEQHPFEYEFVVNEYQGIQKIMDNLQIISNEAEPESFHYTIVGDGYDFSDDKPNMYYRQEATKETLRNLGSNISYDSDYTDMESDLFRFPKSTIFPLYYRRVDTENDIYDSYVKMLDKTSSRDYSGLTGSEILWDRHLGEYDITVHQENVPIDSYWKLITEEDYRTIINNLPKARIKTEKRGDLVLYYLWVKSSRLRGNSLYLEDKWDIQIPSITYMLKNEKWTDKPNICINLDIGAEDIKRTDLVLENLPNTYSLGLVDINKWTYRKETKIRDKYCKIRVRYSGSKLAIISAIITTFTISYA